MADGDLIRAIRDDHEEIKALLALVDAHPDAESFGRLAHKIMVHEATEQELVDPLTARAPSGEHIAKESLEEEAAGSEALEKLEKLGVEGPGFAAAFSEFRRDVLAHAEHEEAAEHPKLIASVDASRLDQLGEVFRTEEQSRIDASA